MSAKGLHIFERQAVERYLHRRNGEQKVGERLRLADRNDWTVDLGRLRAQGVRYALIGIPESVGPLANLGRCCSEHAWPAFLSAFLNLQHNRFLNGERIVCLGAVHTAAVNAEAALLDGQQPEDIARLRRLCTRLDRIVSAVLENVFASGLIPIVIGGGHNNAYPLIKSAACALAHPQGIGCVNVDPHADLRPREGRHSGNSFRYALDAGYLQRYFVVGLHEVYNTETMLDLLTASNQIGFAGFDPGETPSRHVEEIVSFFPDPALPVGLDIDLDAIANMPSSAMTPSGYTLDQIRAFLRILAAARPLQYLHLPEGAPALDNPGQMQQVGKSLAYLVSDFIHFQDRCKT